MPTDYASVTGPGGWSIPEVEVTSQLLALRAVLAVLDHVDCPARPLAMYFLGPLKRHLVPRGLGNAGPTAEAPPLYYRAIVGMANHVRSLDPGLDLAVTPVSRLAECLAEHNIPANRAATASSTPWRRVVNSSLPPELVDFQWRLGWSVLPTHDRLHRWGQRPDAKCPNCPLPEDNSHVVNECVVARTFWTLISRVFGLRYFSRHGRHSAYAELVFAAGCFAVWCSRCCATWQGRRIRHLFPLLSRTYVLVLQHLEDRLAVLGEQEFLRRWAARFLTVRDGRINIVCNFP